MKQGDAIEIFSEKIRFYLKRAKIKQMYLSTVLSVTPSAVSQMIKCRIVMSRNQLNAVCKSMKLASEEELELQTLLAKIRIGESSLISPFNRFMKNSRREKKLTIVKLSQISKISPIRLKSFEEDYNAEFTLEDAEKLSVIYNCTPDFLMKKLPAFDSKEVTYGYVTTPEEAKLEVADNKFDDYMPQRKIPVINLKILKQYSENGDLFVFSNISCTEEMIYSTDKSIVGVKVKSSNFGFPIPGDMILLVSDKKPFVYVCRLFLCIDHLKNYHILQKFEDKEGFYTCKIGETPEVFKEKIKWALGIHEIKFTPQLLV